MALAKIVNSSVAALVAVVFMLFGAISVYCQVTGATLSGTIPDSSGLQIVPENFYAFRVDHKFSAKDTLFGTYLFDVTDFTQPDSFNNVLLKSHTRRQTVVLGGSHTFGPSVVNAVRLGYSRSHVLNLIPFGAINPAAAQTSLGSTMPVFLAELKFEVQV